MSEISRVLDLQPLLDYSLQLLQTLIQVSRYNTRLSGLVVKVIEKVRSFGVFFQFIYSYREFVLAISQIKGNEKQKRSHLTSYSLRLVFLMIACITDLVLDLTDVVLFVVTKFRIGAISDTLVDRLETVGRHSWTLSSSLWLLLSFFNILKKFEKMKAIGDSKKNSDSVDTNSHFDATERDRINSNSISTDERRVFNKEEEILPLESSITKECCLDEEVRSVATSDKFSKRIFDVVIEPLTNTVHYASELALALADLISPSTAHLTINPHRKITHSSNWKLDIISIVSSITGIYAEIC